MKNFPNINLVIAHKLEARRLIDFFSLKRIESDRYSLFQNEAGMRAIVCGMGFENAKAGVEYMGKAFSHEGSLRAWLNIGIAGHQSADIGTCYIARKITYRKTGEASFPAMVFPAMPTTELVTVDEPELNYPVNVAYDMEAAGYWTGALNCTSLELIQSLKIISDNPEQTTEAITPEFIESLFARNLDSIKQCCEHLQALVSELNKAQAIDPVYTQIVDKIHFTVTQKQQLRRLVQQYTALNRLDELLFENTSELLALGSAKLIINKLSAGL